MLEDGTRAMFVNGAVVTADGQSLILHDEDEISQYSIGYDTGIKITLKSSGLIIQ